MSTKIGAILVLGSFLALIPGITFSQSSSPPIGTWRFNPEKSKMNLSLPPRNLERTYVDRGGGVYIFTQEGNGPDGRSVFSMYVARDDGSEYPMFVRGRDEMGVISVTAVDAYTAEQTETVGNATATATRELSRDGETLTITVNPSDARARFSLSGTVSEVNILVFDKQ